METGFSPIVKAPPAATGFEDIRLTRRYKSLKSAMENQQSCTINQLAKSYSERRAYYRFMSNEKVTVSKLMSMSDEVSCQAAKGKHLLAIGDTSEISLKSQIDHIKDAGRVGKLSDNKTPGFHAHAQILLDAQSGHGLCLSSLLLWNRHPGKGKGKGSDSKRPYEQRESYKWEQGIQDSQDITSQASRVTYVFDREADIFDLYASIASNKPESHLLIRSHYNRKVELEGQEVFLWDALEKTSFSHSYSLKVRPLRRRNESRRKQQQRQKRKALIKVRHRPITLLAPGTASSKSKLNLWVVEALEGHTTVPPGEEPIHWRLITTHPIQTEEQALQIIRWYEKRWMIEQLFRLAKRKGFQIETCELQYLDAILKMTVMVFQAAFTVLRLLLARGKPQAQPIDQVFTPSQRKCLALLNQKYQGNTAKQQNLHPPDQLSWAAWIIGRMGGWKGLTSQGLPGPITMKKGLELFHIYFDAWKLFADA
jgi:hypothetical protein